MLNYIFTTLLVFLNTTLIACTCINIIPEFCHAADTSDYIGLYELIEKPDETYIVLRVLENLNKEIPSDTIKVIGAYGHQCGMSLDVFNEGDSVILNLKHNDEVFFHELTGEPFDYLLTDCSKHYLHYNIGNVFGPINYETDTMNYIEFKQNIFDCFDFFSSVDQIKKEQFLIYPNPVVNNVGLELLYPIQGDITIYDNLGKPVYKKQLRNDLKIEIDLSQFNRGIYFMCIENGNEISCEKIIKM